MNKVYIVMEMDYGGEYNIHSVYKGRNFAEQKAKELVTARVEEHEIVDYIEDLVL